MKVKKIFVVFTFFFVMILSASLVSAQPGPIEKKTPEQRISLLKDRLKLTEEQETQVLPIIKEQMETRKAIFEKYKGQDKEARATIRTEMEKSREETQKRLESILTPEQLEEFKVMQSERPRKMRRTER